MPMRVFSMRIIATLLPGSHACGKPTLRRDRSPGNAGFPPRAHRRDACARRAQRLRSPLSPWPRFAAVFAARLRSVVSDRPTSSDSLMRPRASRRTKRASPLGTSRVRLAAARFVPARLVPARFVPARLVPARFVPARFVPARLVPARLAPARLVPAAFDADFLVAMSLSSAWFFCPRAMDEPAAGAAGSCSRQRLPPRLPPPEEPDEPLRPPLDRLEPPLEPPRLPPFLLLRLLAMISLFVLAGVPARDVRGATYCKAFASVSAYTCRMRKSFKSLYATLMGSILFASAASAADPAWTATRADARIEINRAVDTQFGVTIEPLGARRLAPRDDYRRWRTDVRGALAFRIENGHYAYPAHGGLDGVRIAFRAGRRATSVALRL